MTGRLKLRALTPGKSISIAVKQIRLRGLKFLRHIRLIVRVTICWFISINLQSIAPRMSKTEIAMAIKIALWRFFLVNSASLQLVAISFVLTMLKTFSKCTTLVAGYYKWKLPNTPCTSTDDSSILSRTCWTGGFSTQTVLTRINEKCKRVHLHNVV